MATKLLTGVEVSLPEFGVERKLLAFIEDKSKPVDKKTWFTFDRLDFETGSATLRPTSAEQLRNIAEIMKAYPKVALKLGGYTDNVGNPDDNLKLSKLRAQNTMQELVKSGVDAKRLEAEGYGEKFPVADNSTEDGRAKNRRIDILVTRK
jgi:outer membrane protein OmpA-like peptidoglycan-associated protein